MDKGINARRECKKPPKKDNDCSSEEASLILGEATSVSSIANKAIIASYYFTVSVCGGERADIVGFRLLLRFLSRYHNEEIPSKLIP